MRDYPIICKLCGETLPEDSYSDQYQEWGTADRGPNDPRQVPALYVYCLNCLMGADEGESAE